MALNSQGTETEEQMQDTLEIVSSSNEGLIETSNRSVKHSMPHYGLSFKELMRTPIYLRDNEDDGVNEDPLFLSLEDIYVLRALLDITGFKYNDNYFDGGDKFTKKLTHIYYNRFGIVNQFKRILDSRIPNNKNVRPYIQRLFTGIKNLIDLTGTDISNEIIDELYGSCEA